ncbi:MAG: FAD:protein FMN transferase [Jatrophihabitans sp.]
MSAPTQIRLPQRRTVRCMGTVFSIDVRAPGVDRAVVESAVRWLHWADDTFSTYKPSSQINRLARGEITIDACAPEIGDILQRCDELGTETGGYFSAWASGCLDPSGLVKGWAIERVSDILRAGGSANHCVNGGGDVQCAGSAAPGAPWRIGVAHPLKPDQLVGIASGHDIAVATSGNAERGAHILDPHQPARPTDLASVTLIGQHLATVDAYATAAFAMGARAPAWINAVPDIQGLLVFADGAQWASATSCASATMRPEKF